ncbi:MAG: MarR family winged helix-turn-helix transcriptional regulator [Microthrixaceae bacterium]
MTEDVQTLFSELFEASAAGRRAGEEIAGVVGQTQARWQTLWTIGDASLTVPQIGRRLGVSRQAVQRLVNELANEALVELVDNPDHKTSPLVSLTRKGRTALDRINRAGEAFNEALLTEFGAEHIARLRTLLREFVSVVNSVPALGTATDG